MMYNQRRPLSLIGPKSKTTTPHFAPSWKLNRLEADNNKIIIHTDRVLIFSFYVIIIIELFKEP